MKLFQATKKLCNLAGLGRLQAFSIFQLFNFRTFIGIFILILFCIFSTAFCFTKAENLGEFSYAFYISVTLLNGIGYFSLTAAKFEKVLKLIENFEDLIRKRKRNKF